MVEFKIVFSFKYYTCFISNGAQGVDDNLGAQTYMHTSMLGVIHTCLDIPDIHTCSQVSNMHARLTISNIHACLGASNIHTCIHTHYSPVALIKTSLTAHVQSQILATHSITLMNIHCGLSVCALSKFPIKSPLLSSYS